MENTKTIPFENLTEELKAKLSTSLSILEELKNEIAHKQASIAEKSNSLKDILEKLKSQKSVTVDNELAKQFSNSEKYFKQITQILFHEIDFHIGYYSKYLAEDHPKEVTIIDENDNSTFLEYIELSAKLLKTFAKNRKKELDIVFSRYENGFNNQLRRLSNVQAYFNTQKS